jgi:hypothetical protein
MENSKIAWMTIAKSSPKKPGHKLQAAQLAHPQGASHRNHHPGNCVKLFDINVGAVAGQKFYFRIFRISK